MRFQSFIITLKSKHSICLIKLPSSYTMMLWAFGLNDIYFRLKYTLALGSILVLHFNLFFFNNLLFKIDNKKTMSLSLLNHGDICLSNLD